MSIISDSLTRSEAITTHLQRAAEQRNLCSKINCGWEKGAENRNIYANYSVALHLHIRDVRLYYKY